MSGTRLSHQDWVGLLACDDDIPLGELSKCLHSDGDSGIDLKHTSSWFSGPADNEKHFDETLK